MKTADEIVSEKFDEITHAKLSTPDYCQSLTRGERAIWLLVTLRCEIDMGGFVSVIEQALSKSELVEAIGYLREMDVSPIADLLEHALAVLDANNFYTQDGTPSTMGVSLPQQYQDELITIGQKITKDDLLWGIDEKLASILNR